MVPDALHGHRLLGSLTYAALEAFKADNRSRLYYRVTGFSGEMVAGFADLPPWRGTLPTNTLYAALVHFYDDHYQGEPVRVAVLLQPVAGVYGLGMATIQVAETLELRQTLARQILLDTLWRQSLLIALIGLVVFVVVQRATLPVRRLSAALAARPENDLSPLDSAAAPTELQPLLQASNQHMARLSDLLQHQKRFVRDTSHQIKTPLAVLRTQLQSALRGDVDTHPCARARLVAQRTGAQPAAQRHPPLTARGLTAHRTAGRAGAQLGPADDRRQRRRPAAESARQPL